MADFNHSKIPEDSVGQVSADSVVGSTGTNMNSKRLLGALGAGGPGRGGWYRTNGMWKTFMLYNVDRVGAINATVSVRIEACMELAGPPNDPDADTFFIELAALTGASPSFSTEYPWRWVRARVAGFAGTKNVQVGLFEQGQG